MALLYYSHRRLVTIGAVVLVLFIFFPTLFGMPFPASDNVSCSAGISSSPCERFLSMKNSLTAFALLRKQILLATLAATIRNPVRWK